MFAGALVACTPNGAPAPVTSNASLPAPTPSDVATHVGAGQSGQRVEVGVGRRFAIELVGAPTAGYIWAVTQAPAFVALSEGMSGPTSAAQTQPGFVGGNHWEVFVFTVSGAGEGEIVMEQRRPWEDSEPPADTFRVTIEAR
jgi:inhibitor of cysteine peptidase